MKNVMIVCQCATNKGDRAIAEYLINDLLQKDVSITLSATDPHLWENVKNKGVKVICTGYQTFFGRPENKFFRKIDHEISNLYYSYLIYPDVALSRKSKRIEKISREYIDNLKKSDLVIVTGGHHITSIRNKNAMFSITYDIALASMYSKRYVLWSQTIGPLEFDDIKYKEIFGNIIKKADAVYIRDKKSKRCIDELVGHNQKNVYKSYDSVFGFGNGEFIPYEKRNNKVGISIFNGLKKAYDTYPVLAEMLDSFAVKGNEIEFFRMENDESELNDIQSVISLMKTKWKLLKQNFMIQFQAVLL